MSDSIKIERDGVKAEVLERYLPDFLKDGWVKSQEEHAEEHKKDKTIHLNK